MAAAVPDLLPGPGGTPILTAGYEGFSKGSWSELAGSSPMTAKHITVLSRMYGVYNAAFGLTIGSRTPLGRSSCLKSFGLVAIYGALAITAPFLAAGRPVRSTG